MQIVFSDTPGFDDTDRADADILRDIAHFLAMNYVEGHKLTAILYLHRITDNQLSGSAMRNLKMFKKLIGSSALPNVILVTTMWDLVDQAIGANRERQLVTTPEFWGDMVSRGSTVVHFDGTKECAFDILRSRLKEETRVLTIQKEIVDSKITLAKTKAGKEVLAAITETKLSYQRQIEALRKEALHKEAAEARALAKVSEEYQHKLVKAEAQISVLQSRSPEIEALQIRHEQELKRLQGRISILEEQASIPPPSYMEVEMTSEENVRIPTRRTASRNTKMPQSIVFHLWTLFIWLIKFIQLLLRPRVPAGYRRLEWTCVCFVFPSQGFC